MIPLNQRRIHEELRGEYFDIWAGELDLPVAEEKSPPEMIWIDMETTGLVALQDLPLEIGLVLTDRRGRLIRDGAARWLIFDCTDSYWPNQVYRMSEFVRAMHERSGLLGDLAALTTDLRAYSAPPSEVEQSILNWLAGQFSQFDFEAKLLPCGSNVGFDRKFLELWMPSLHEWLHYRNGDVSAWRYFVSLHRPEVLASAPEKKAFHRALPDIADSIRLYRHLLDLTLIREA